ncbi:hypothetical protein RvY_05898-2 [Ramazzottius varieornatus]|nr:hypothetical protein RvY_05898-2 [Ramazzottius varieornatus]
MDGFLDNDESSSRRIGVHIRDDLQVAIVSSDVITNSSKILENSQAYLEDTKNFLSQSGDIIDLVRENATNVENLRDGVLAGRQLLQTVKEGKSTTRKEILKAIANVRQEYEA